MLQVWVRRRSFFQWGCWISFGSAHVYLHVNGCCLHFFSRDFLYGFFLFRNVPLTLQRGLGSSIRSVSWGACVVLHTNPFIIEKMIIFYIWWMVTLTVLYMKMKWLWVKVPNTSRHHLTLLNFPLRKSGAFPGWWKDLALIIFPPLYSSVWVTFYEHFAIRPRGFCRESNLWPPKLAQMEAQSRSKGRLSATVIITLIY